VQPDSIFVKVAGNEQTLIRSLNGIFDIITDCCDDAGLDTAWELRGTLGWRVVHSEPGRLQDECRHFTRANVGALRAFEPRSASLGYFSAFLTDAAALFSPARTRPKAWY
jgi:hypothetical protein